MAEANRTALTFSGKNRTLAAEDKIVLMSAGIDIGSSTSQLVFSRVVMERLDSRYAVESRELLFESTTLLTPYREGSDIDAQALKEFIGEQYLRAGLTGETIDVGVLIMTGVAARRRNARAIGEALAIETGKFVAVSAGDKLETTLVAHGSGAVRLSHDEGLRVMAVDVGGGTSKIAVCERGEIIDHSVIEVGARLLCLDDAGRIRATEAASRFLAEEADIALEIGGRLTAAEQDALAEHLSARLFQAMGAETATDGLTRWLRTEPLADGAPPDVLLFSGGVAEYLYGRETGVFGDLGALLAAAIARRAAAWGIPVRKPTHAIRATVLGASQYTVQLSGSTIFATPESALPLRNVMAIHPNIVLDAERIDPRQVGAAVRTALRQLGPQYATLPAALCFDWQGSATHQRLDAFCRGVLAALEPQLRAGGPLVIVTQADVGGLIGMHLRSECAVTSPIVSIDGIALAELDFVDIGALIESSGAVPVVIKSLLFSESR